MDIARVTLMLTTLALPAHAECDPTSGRAIFQQECARCHAVTQDVAKRGPSLQKGPFEADVLAARGVSDLAASHRKTDGLTDPDKLQALVCFLNAPD